MKSKSMIFIFCSCLTFTGCAKTNISTFPDISSTQIEKTTEQNIENKADDTAIPKSVTKNYEVYSGFWSENGLSHDEILSNGGTEFNIQITDNNNLEGYLFTQQGTSERIAEIDNIAGRIDDGTISYRFNDDGWGGSGILYITFSNDMIQIEVQDYKMKDTNLSGYGISGAYKLIRTKKSEAKVTKEEITESETTDEEFLDAIHERYYSHWSESDMINAINERKQYLEKCSFYPEVVKYLETVREVTDISSVVEPLYYTDMRIYQKQDFDQVPPLIIHLAKNEIYARHGYIFKNEDLYNYFKGQLWYEPSISPDKFEDIVFNKNEQTNLRLLTELDTYK